MKLSSILFVGCSPSIKDPVCSDGPRFNGSRQRRLFSFCGGLGIGGIWRHPELVGVEFAGNRSGEEELSVVSR